MIFVTLFDSRYLLRGLTLYESLLQQNINFTLYIIAFNEECYTILQMYNLKNVVVISMDEFEDQELLEIKPTRSRAEYCWTCTAKSVLYVLDNYDVEMCTYIDSDLFFYGNPQILLNELENDESVLITEHRFSDYCDETSVVGKYCVQFMTFKKDEKGLKVLNWWKDRCLEWCYARSEPGKWGDQKYLDNWCEDFEGIHVLKHLGGGVASWNVSQYTFSEDNKQVMLRELISDNIFPLIFYHFHGLELFDKNVVRLATRKSKLPDTSIIYVYKKYLRMMDAVCNKYDLWKKREVYRNESLYISDDMDALKHESNFYHYSLFV